MTLHLKLKKDRLGGNKMSMDDIFKLPGTKKKKKGKQKFIDTPYGRFPIG